MIDTKQCSKCKIIKPINHFNKAPQLKNGLRSACKECQAQYNKKYVEENKEIIISKQQTYYKNNKETILVKRNQYRQNNIEEIRDYDRNRPNKEIRKQQTRKRRDQKRKNDPVFRLREHVSKRIAEMLSSQNSSKKGESILKYLDYTVEELREYLENQFSFPANLTSDGKVWMTWENYGIYNPSTHTIKPTWQLDHIIPRSDLPYDSMTHSNFIKCWALSNLRPLDSKQNNYDGVYRIRHKKKDKVNVK